MDERWTHWSGAVVQQVAGTLDLETRPVADNPSSDDGGRAIEHGVRRAGRRGVAGLGPLFHHTAPSNRNAP